MMSILSLSRTRAVKIASRIVAGLPIIPGLFEWWPFSQKLSFMHFKPCHYDLARSFLIQGRVYRLEC